MSTLPRHPPVTTVCQVYFAPYAAQDARVIPLPGRENEVLLAVFTLPHPTNSVMPGVALVVRRPSSDPFGDVFFGSPWRLHPPEWPDFSGREKNWSPFVHNGSVLFIKSINPLTVVGVKDWKEIIGDAANATLVVKEDVPGRPVPTYVVSAAPLVPGTIDWGHGHMRGGTQALLVGGAYYLSFFHTATHLKGSSYTTYFMGAYAFTRDSPFSLLAVSRYPIVDDSLYTGPWNTRFTNRMIDYVVFPMHFYLRGAWLHLTVGHQDASGKLLSLPLDDVVRGMRNVSDTWDALKHTQLDTHT